MESEEGYTVQQAESPLMQRIDIQATYKMSAVLPHLYHIPVTYMNKGQYNAFAKRRPQLYNKTGLALWMHNNCQALSSRRGPDAMGIPHQAAVVCCKTPTLRVNNASRVQ